MNLLIAILSFLVLLPSTGLAAVTPQRTIPMYSRYCNYGYCNPANIYYYTPTPYVPVNVSDYIYRTYLPPVFTYHPGYYHPPYRSYYPIYRNIPISNNYYPIGDCSNSNPC